MFGNNPDTTFTYLWGPFSRIYTKINQNGVEGGAIKLFPEIISNMLAREELTPDFSIVIGTL
jgi:hypothetical protein